MEQLLFMLALLLGSGDSVDTAGGDDVSTQANDDPPPPPPPECPPGCAWVRIGCFCNGTEQIGSTLGDRPREIRAVSMPSGESFELP
jgi:hypothetical protein